MLQNTQKKFRSHLFWSYGYELKDNVKALTAFLLLFFMPLTILFCFYISELSPSMLLLGMIVSHSVWVGSIFYIIAAGKEILWRKFLADSEFIEEHRIRFAERNYPDAMWGPLSDGSNWPYDIIVSEENESRSSPCVS